MMTDWLHELRDLTEAHREGRARQFDEGAKRRRARSRLKGALEARVHEDARWHTSRARGQRNKIENVQSCGSETLRITCQGCGLSRDRPGRCGNSLLCLRCRGALADEKRRKFLLARLAVLAAAKPRGLLDRNRRRGRFSEKLLTLTSPHLVHDTVASRIDRTAKAWVVFRRWIRKYVKKRDAPTFEWFRVLEWTLGDDGLGHPHLHLWMFSCYLDVELLKDAWRGALIKAGCPAAECQVVIIDVKEFDVRNGRGAQELIKYLTKDIDVNGDKVPAQVYAEVYKAFDGRRITQGSRGFMALAEREAMRCECGACLPRRVRKLPAAASETAVTGGER
jgi:hypothetical protein